MKQILLFISDYSDLIVTFLLSFIGIIQAFKFRFQSKLLKNQNKEDTTLKYRKEDYQEEPGYKKFAQKFERVVDELDLDEDGNHLVVVGKKDLQELIQSSADCALQAVFDKYGVLPTVEAPRPSQIVDDVADMTTSSLNRYELALKLDEELDVIRGHYGMPNASVEELMDANKIYQSRLEQFIESKSKNKEVSNNETNA